MSYQISKYEAIKVALAIEERNNIKLMNQLMHTIRRATANEMKTNIYTQYYEINESEKKAFEKALRICTIDESTLISPSIASRTKKHKQKCR